MGGIATQNICFCSDFDTWIGHIPRHDRSPPTRMSTKNMQFRECERVHFTIRIAHCFALTEWRPRLCFLSGELSHQVRRPALLYSPVAESRERCPPRHEVRRSEYKRYHGSGEGQRRRRQQHASDGETSRIVRGRRSSTQSGSMRACAKAEAAAKISMDQSRPAARTFIFQAQSPSARSLRGS